MYMYSVKSAVIIRIGVGVEGDNSKLVPFYKLCLQNYYSHFM